MSDLTQQAPLPTMEGIENFYRGKSIFLTGVTGFVGNVLLEKLLRSCPDLNMIYVLIRERKGQSAEDRLQEVLSFQSFEPLRQSNPKFADKVKVVRGDVGQEQLGLDESDRALMRNVSVIIHSAADVRFEVKFRSIVQSNVGGVRSIIQLSRSLQKLESLVYVSTAFSNCYLQEEIQEKVYEPSIRPADLLQLLRICNDDMLEGLAPHLLGSFPNKYIFTKCLAEALLKDEASDLPVAIVRPSGITPAFKEPLVGWVNALQGTSTLVQAVGTGMVKAVYLSREGVADSVPVDITANCLIAAAWDSATKRTTNLTVYNNTSFAVITWRLMFTIVNQMAVQFPMKSIIRYPGVEMVTNKWLYAFYHIFYHVIPAYLLDAVRFFQGKKSFGVKMLKKKPETSRSTTFRH